MARCWEAATVTLQLRPSLSAGARQGNVISSSPRSRELRPIATRPRRGDRAREDRERRGGLPASILTQLRELLEGIVAVERDDEHGAGATAHSQVARGLNFAMAIPAFELLSLAGHLFFPVAQPLTFRAASFAGSPLNFLRLATSTAGAKAFF